MSSRFANNNGFSVIELMVAVAISGFLLIGLIQIFSSVRASYDLQESLARLQENQRFAETFITQELAPAGNISFARHERESQIAQTLQVAPPVFSEVDLGSLRVSIDEDGTTEGSNNTSDALAVNYYTDRDCTGVRSNPAVVGIKQVVFSHDANTEELLYTCRFGPANTVGNPPTVIDSQPILSNVETLQFIYGDTFGACPAANTNPFITASTSTRSNGATRYVRRDFWCSPESVVSVRVGLILASPEIGSLPPDEQTLTMLEPGVNAASNTYPPTGRNHLRRPVIFNVNLRNRTF